jgi:hypothetical protein
MDILHAFPLNSGHTPSRCEVRGERWTLPSFPVGDAVRVTGNIKFLTVAQWYPILIGYLRLILFRSKLKDLHNIIISHPVVFPNAVCANYKGKYFFLSE